MLIGDGFIIIKNTPIVLMAVGRVVTIVIHVYLKELHKLNTKIPTVLSKKAKE